jgi:FkbM family methyltransferase
LQDLKLARYYLKNGEVELRLVPALCSPGRDSLDVGANEGMYLHLMRKYSRHVFAYEPVDDLHAKLSRRYHSKVTIEKLALSNRTGSAMLHVPVAGGQSVSGLSSLADVATQIYGACREVEIRTARLDDIYKRDAGFIKIDVEGHELAVLEGAAATIAASLPNLLIETEEHLTPGGLPTVTAMLRGLGYQGYFVQGGTLRPVEEFDAGLWQNPVALANFGPGHSRQEFPDYINNFIFIQAGNEQLRSRLSARLIQPAGMN